MSITCLSNPKGKREWWMLPFETYFGITIKFINPACLLFIFFHNLYEDLQTPYSDQTQRMYMVSTLPVFIAALILIIPIFTCSYPEIFNHDVNKEFMADVIYEKRLRRENEAKKDAEPEKKDKEEIELIPPAGNQTENQLVDGQNEEPATIEKEDGAEKKDD